MGGLRRIRRAFTLVELLVVIGIIALLISILLPSLNRAREAAKATLCLSNLRSIGQAAMIYSNTFKGQALPAGYAHPTEKAGSTGTSRDTETWTTILVNEKILTAPDVGVLDGPISAEKSVFRCPSGTEDFSYSEYSTGKAEAGLEVPNRAHGLAHRPIRGRSDLTGVVVDSWYGINATHTEFKTILHPGRRIPDEKNKKDFSLVKVSQIRDSSRLVMIFDGVWINVNVDADRIAARHNNFKTTNILFYDGHAGSYTTADLPGGMGPNPRNSDRFSNAAIGTKTELKWRLDGK